MEDVLDVYGQPYDRVCPDVTFDECPVQLTGQRKKIAYGVRGKIVCKLLAINCCLQHILPKSLIGLAVHVKADVFGLSK